MNANELAKMLFHYWNKTEGVEISPTLLNDAADMLRQQQAELEHMRSFFGCDPAYYGMTKTHPVKELTDELLMELYEVADYSPESYLELARAILRKASEK